MTPKTQISDMLYSDLIDSRLEDQLEEGVSMGMIFQAFSWDTENEIFFIVTAELTSEDK